MVHINFLLLAKTFFSLESLLDGDITQESVSGIFRMHGVIPDFV
jgi:hypothetical protein